MAVKSILAVDDSRLARMLFQRVIAVSCPNWRFHEACDGPEALNKVAEEPPDVALVDLNMPGMNGLELAVKLREKHPDMTIALVTANIQERVRSRVEKSGFIFFEKPLTQEKVEKLLKGLEQV